MLTEKLNCLPHNTGKLIFFALFSPRLKITSSSSLDIFFLCKFSNSLYLFPLFSLIPLVLSFEISWLLSWFQATENPETLLKFPQKEMLLTSFTQTSRGKVGFHAVRSCLAKFLCSPFGYILGWLSSLSQGGFMKQAMDSAWSLFHI